MYYNNQEKRDMNNVYINPYVAYKVAEAAWRGRKTEDEWMDDKTIYPKGEILISIPDYEDREHLTIKIADGVHIYGQLTILRNK